MTHNIVFATNVVIKCTLLNSSVVRGLWGGLNDSIKDFSLLIMFCIHVCIIKKNLEFISTTLNPEKLHVNKEYVIC